MSNPKPYPWATRTRQCASNAWKMRQPMSRKRGSPVMRHSMYSDSTASGRRMLNATSGSACRRPPGATADTSGARPARKQSPQLSEASAVNCMLQMMQL